MSAQATASNVDSASKHTPGPWRIFRATDGRKFIGIGEVTGEGITDAGFGTWRSGAEQEANVCLIAAAPTLLAALKTALAGLEIAGHGATRIAEDCRTAIAKAEGRKALAKAAV